MVTCGGFLFPLCLWFRLGRGERKRPCGVLFMGCVALSLSFLKYLGFRELPSKESDAVIRLSVVVVRVLEVLELSQLTTLTLSSDCLDTEISSSFSF